MARKRTTKKEKKDNAITIPSLTDDQKKEVGKLSTLAGVIVGVLLFFIVLSGVLIVKLFKGDVDGNSYKILILAIAGGALGSSISALISVVGRIAAGWELSCGTKVPTEEHPDKFLARMAPFFIGRPFLGGAMGLLVYTGLTSGFLILATDKTSKADFSPEGLLFFAILGGLFAKTFLAKLKEVFKALVGSSPDKGSGPSPA